MGMTSRERVSTALGYREPDRVPFNLRPGPQLIERLRRETGAEDLAEHFGHDLRYVALPAPARPPQVPATEWTPRPSPQDCARAAEETSATQARGLAVCSAYVCGVFEEAKAWLGDEAALVAPHEDPRGFERILDRITEMKRDWYAAYAAAGVDIVWIGDDLGTQRSLVMSPQQYRAWYRPRHEFIVNSLRAARPEVKIAFHCCGHVTPLVADLIEIGVDILEAVQPEAMDIAGLKREFGRDIAFWGGVGAQSVLAASPAEVGAGVREALRVMAPGGGYIAAPCHTLTEEVPWENVLAFHEAVAAYGAYPGPGGAMR